MKTNPAARAGSTTTNDRQVAVLLCLAVVWLASYGCRLLLFTNPDPEVVQNGMFATGLLDGLAAPPMFYQNCGGSGSPGSLVYGALLAPVFFFAGSKLLWIVLLGAGFVAGAVFLWAALVRRAWGFSRAALLLLFFIFAPPYFDQSCRASFWGNHLESTFFAGLLLFLFLRLADPPPSFRTAGAFWFLAGATAAFSWQSLPLAAALAAAFVWRWRAPGLRRFVWPGLPFFFVGFRLGLIANLLGMLRGPGIRAAAAAPGGLWSQLNPFGRVSNALRTSESAGFFEKMGALFFRHLPHLAGYDKRGLAAKDQWDAIAGHFFDWRLPLFGQTDVSALSLLSFAFLALALYGFFLAGREALERRTAGAPPERGQWLSRLLVLYFLSWLAAYGAAKYPLEPLQGDLYDFYHERFLLPLFPILLCFFCYAIHALRPILRPLATAPFVIVGVLQTFVFLPTHPHQLAEKWRMLNARRGDSYEALIARYLPFDGGGDRLTNLTMIRKLPERWRRYAWVALGAQTATPAAPAWLFVDSGASPNAAERSSFAVGAGRRLGAHFADLAEGKPETADLAARDRARQTIGERGDPAMSAAFVKGVGWGLARSYVDDYPAGSRIECSPSATDEQPSSMALIYCRERAPLADLARAFPRLSPAEFAQAMALGAGVRLGMENDAMTAAQKAQIGAFWTALLGADAAGDLGAWLQRGFVEGLALRIVDRDRCFVFAGEPPELPALQAELDKYGATLRPTGRAPHEFNVTLKK